MKIECASSVTRVVVHARGALVTREVDLPSDLPVGVVDVELPAITLFAEPGSARASLHDSDRVVSAVHAAVVVPSGEIVHGPTLVRVRELTTKVSRLNSEHRALTERRQRLASLALTPEIRERDTTKRERDAFDVRFGDALRMASLLRGKVNELDERLLALEAEHRLTTRALEAAQLEDRQTSSPVRHDHPTRTLVARLAGEGRPGRLAVTYAVTAARWWPVYTLRIDGKTREAAWAFEAIVAQKSGEDWSSVELALSSADLVFDARLPELASLRFGRAQAPARRAFRPAPKGVDEMFAAYLGFGGGAFSAHPLVPQVSSAVPRSGALDFLSDEGADEDEETIVTAAYEDSAKMDRVRRATAPAARAMPFAPQMAAASFGPPPGPPPPPRAAYGAPAMPQAMLLGSAIGGGGGPDGFAASRSEAEPEIVPSEAWNDHDALVLAHADDPQRRGRLVRRPAAEDAAGLREAEAAVDRARGPRLRDPAESRGMFDHRYEAEGAADVPSDGRAHRVTVGTESSRVKIDWRTVPSERPDVFREANLVNPFPTGLLGGPVDVYLDGSLLTTTSIERIDRGGGLTVGMGVDDRLKVARNVRVVEESAGILGGSLSVTHTVEIEIGSTIGEPVTVAVLERVPVTDDKAIEIKTLKASPPPESYDQADRGAPVRGGLRFVVVVDPARKTRVELAYRLQFSGKLDIVGGSRRG